MRTAARNIVIIANPPNTSGDGKRSGTGYEHSDWANYPHLGALKLCSALAKVEGVETVYFDGTVRPVDELIAFIAKNSERILVLGLSVLTASYGAGLQIAKNAKAIDDKIVVIFGNDHFTACADICLSNQPAIDGGFVGNEVFSGLVGLVSGLLANDGKSTWPAYLGRSPRTVATSVNEAIYTDIDYSLIDRHFMHSTVYRSNLQKRVGPRIHKMTGERIASGVPVEFARGCLKFRNNDACSFCSIQYGGMWSKAASAAEAWGMIEKATASGYDLLYITTDELALTFPKLLKDMAQTAPRKLPFMVGYSRADGLANARSAERLVAAGVRIVMVGLDGASAD